MAALSRRAAMRAAVGSVAALAAAPLLNVRRALAGSSYPGDPQPQVRIRGGCIRLGPPGPYLHVATDHSAIGIVDVDTNAAGDLVITTDFDSSEETLVSAIAAVDFQLAAKRINCGISGGGTTSTIRFTKQTDGSQVDADSSFWNPSVDNIWFQTVSVVTP